jgi:bifunctional non-homologous end joining protein LigD
MAERTQSVAGQKLEFSHTDKLYFPDDGISKGDLLTYYERIAPTMLPHLHDRPLTMQRFPDGINEDGFYQKEAADYFPDWLPRVEVEVKEDQSSQEQVMANDAAALLYLVNQGMITPHIWLSRAGSLNYPDKLIFDLDPPKDNFELVRFAAKELRRRLEDLGLAPFVMTTGSKGLHIAVALDGQTDFDAVRAFARKLAEIVAEEHPGRLTTALRKDQREGRLFLDYVRNAYGQTGVAPYAVRALAGAPVATPLDWDEVGNSDLDSQAYTIKNIFKRLGQKADPWKDFYQHPASVAKAAERLV